MGYQMGLRYHSAPLEFRWALIEKCRHGLVLIVRASRLPGRTELTPGKA